MPLGGAVILLVVCIAGVFFAKRKWMSEHKYGFLVLSIVLSIVSLVLALYTAMSIILINAVR